MRTLILALVIAPLWVGPALAQESRKAARTSRAAARDPDLTALERRLAALESTLERKRPEVSLEVQVRELAERVSALEERVSALEGTAAASRLQALEEVTEETSEQVASLLDVIEVTGTGVEIASVGTLSLEAGAGLEVVASQATVSAAIVEIAGILKAMSVQAKTVSAQEYTPGAGNIW